MKNQLILILLLFLTACQPNSCLIEPTFCYAPPEKFLEKQPSAFEDLSPTEIQEDWGKELLIGETFSRERDFYRAITCYRRAEILIPEISIQRRLQIEYDIILCYYIAGKYQDAIEIFEDSDLTKLTPCFPAFSNLLIILYDSYQKIENEEKAFAILKLIEKFSPETARDLTLSTAFIEGNVGEAECLSFNQPSYTDVSNFLCEFHLQEKSVRKAQLLNAMLPGAGYLYVGQKKSALTSFIINALFTAAAYQFYHKGYIAAGAITTSLELGWYIGGINGAGLAAKFYNERIYEECGKEALIKARLFPVLMLETVF